jgi:hypothetical protein
VQKGLLKEKEEEILSLKNYQAKEAVVVNELTRKSFLAKDACTRLESKKVERQGSLKCLEASHIAIEVQLDNLKNSAKTTSNDATSNSNPSITNGYSRCYKLDLNDCATNIAEMNAMKKEIARLSNSLIEKKKKKEESLRTIPRALVQTT